MKAFKLLAAGLFALAFVGSASAQTVIRLTGAQAFGDATHRAIAHLLGASGAAPYTLAGAATYAYTGTDINKAQQAIFTGTIAGNSVIIKTSFNGSTAGIRITSQGTSINWLNSSTPQSAGGTANASTASPEVAPSEGAVVDSFQSSTQWISPTLTDRVVGAGAYVFVAGKGAPANLTNITTSQAQALYNIGNLPIAVLTGSSSDRTTLVSSTFGNSFFGGPAPVQVYATGRDPESGARLISLIETGIGGLSVIQQFKPVIGGPVASFTVTSGGTGYTSAPTVRVAGSGGSGYTSAPTVVFTGGGGSGASATATITNGAVTEVAVNAGGSGYTSIPTISFTGGGGSGATATATYSNGQVTSVQLANPGSGATATATVSGGVVTAVTLGTAGNGYASAPTVSFTGGGGTGAAATAVLGTLTITNQALYPASTLNGQPLTLGNDGNTSNGTLATTVLAKDSLAGLGGYYISYLPTLDAANAVLAGAKLLKYNGVDYTPTNVSEGAYSLWAYEHLLYKSGLAAPRPAVLDAIADQLLNFDATLLIGNLQVSRAADGTSIFNNY